MTKYKVGKHFTKGKHWLGLAFVVNTKKADDENYFLNLQETVDLLNNLHEENEQLKEELQRFKKYVFSEDNILCYKCEHCIKKDIYVVDCEMKGEVDVHGLCSLFREVKV